MIQLESMARAAEELYLAPSSVTMQVQDLERKLGARLLVRSGRRVSGTPAGAILYARAQSILSTLDALAHDLSELSALEAGILRFASSRTIGSHLVPPALREFARRFPRVDVEYHLMVSSEHAKFAVVEERAEFALLGRVGDHGALEMRPLLEEPLIVVVAPNHPLAATGEPRLLDLNAHTVLLREYPVLGSAHIRDALEHAGATPTIVQLESTEAIRAAAAEGRGVAILPQTAVADEVAAGTLRACSIAGFAPHRTVYVVSRQHAPLSAAARAFLATMLELHERGSVAAAPP